MLFNSTEFALFLPIMLLIYWQLRGEARRWALLVGSYVFYSCWDWRFTGLLLVSTIVDYTCGLAMQPNKSVHARKTLVAISACANLGILAVFKYFNFFQESMAALLQEVGVHVGSTTLNVVLPVGVSFYTFQTLSYTIDVYRGATPERNLRDFAIFVACFPQLVAGPIMRAADLIPQIKREHRFADAPFSKGAYRILQGLFKKMVVAESLALYVDTVFADPSAFSGASCWIALYAYAFQIYMDFSGYCDVALGVGLMLNLKLAENFDRPYLSASPAEFWRRWHITLSMWLKDYLYVPLGGSRGGKLLTLRNLFITMGLGGLWHGASWTFVAWGMYHGFLLCVQRLFRTSLRASSATAGAPAIVKTLVTFHLVCIGWMLFRAADFGVVATFSHQLFTLAAGPLHGKRILLIVIACVIAHGWPARLNFSARILAFPPLARGAIAGLCVWAVVLMSPTSRSFIYFQF